MPGSARPALPAPSARPSFALTRVEGLRVEAEDFLESKSHRDIDIAHRHQDAQIVQAGHAELADAAGYDAVEMREIGVDVERHAVKRHPAPHAYADGGDL